MSEPRPCSAVEAVQRAIRWVEKGGVYWLGCGDYRAQFIGGSLVDAPWTPVPPPEDDNALQAMHAGDPASDCRFAINYCYKLPAKRKGFNRGPWSSVEDWINYNSAIEDSEHARDLFETASGVPFPGDVVCYPTIYLQGADGLKHKFTGHGALVISVVRAAKFELARPNWSLLDIVHCHGPNGRGPAITRSNGAVFDHHDSQWHKPEHACRLLRIKP